MFGFVELDEVYYAGSHGMDIMGPATQVKSYDAKYQTRTVDKKVGFIFLRATPTGFLHSFSKTKKN